jgi:hypothetical protein
MQLDKTLVESPFLYADNGNEIDVVEYARVSCERCADGVIFS